MIFFRSCAAFLSFVFLAACVGGEPEEGEERGPCHPDGGCDEDYLVCNQDNVCVVPERGERGAPCRDEWDENDRCDDGLFCDSRGFCQAPGDCEGPGCGSVDCGPGFHAEGSECVEDSYGVVMGKIVDARTQTAVGNAKVALGQTKVATNEQGFFSVSNVPAEIDSVLDIRAEGYANNKRTVIARTGASTHLDVRLLPFAAQASFSADSGGTVEGDGAKASFGVGAIDAGGTVKANLYVLHTDDERDLPAFPGDFLTDNEEKLEGFGALSLQLVDDSGDEVPLNPDGEVEVEIPVTADAPDELPLYYLDEGNARWMRQGTLSGCGDGVCEGVVSGHSWWSLGEVMETSCAEVCVDTISGDPAVGVSVRVQGSSYNSISYGYTRSDGCACVDVKRDAEVQVSAAFSGGMAGPEYTSTPGNSATCGSPDCERLYVSLTISPPVFQASLTWGESPDDLDAHLTGPCDPDDGGCSDRFHVYFANEGTLDSPPWAYLDTDDVSSFGPEIMSISKCIPGTYRYSVNNSTELPGFDVSEANVFIIFPDGGVQDIDIPGGAGPDDLVWVVGELDCIPSGGGSKGDCDCGWQTLNQFMPNEEASYHPGADGSTVTPIRPPGADGGSADGGICEPMTLTLASTGDPCRLTFGPEFVDDSSLLTIRIDGEHKYEVGDCADDSYGWRFEPNTIIFCPDACDAIASGGEIDAELGCPP
jgi:hypothetical protein